MPTLAEPRPNNEIQFEAPQTAERISNTPENNEEMLRTLIEQVHNQIETEEARVLGSADKRMTDSSSLEQQKAASILREQGFGSRIGKIRENILALGIKAKKKIDTFVGSKPESNLPVHSKDILSLDSYMVRRKKSEGLNAIKDKARLAHLKLKRIQDPERTLGLINYLEDKGKSWEHKVIWVKNSNKSREDYEKKGYYAYFIGEKTQNGKARLSISKDIPLHFDMSNARGVADLLNTANDPVEIFERLQSMGYKMNQHDFSFYIDNVKKFIDNPNILAVLKKLEKVKGGIGLQKEYSFFKDNGEAENFSAFAEKEARDNKLDETAVKNLSAVSEIVGRPLNAQSLENWLTIANDPETVELLKVARDYGKNVFPKDSDDALIAGLQVYKNAGIAGEVVALVKAGFEPDSFSLNRFGSYSIGEIVASVIPIVQELKSNPDFRKFILEVSAALGTAPTLDTDTTKKLREYYTYPRALRILQILSKHGLINAKDFKYSYYKAEDIFNNTEKVEMITQPGFEDFLTAMSRAGYKLAYPDLFPSRGNSSLLLEAYGIEKIRLNIAKEENISLVNHLGLFKESGNWNLTALEVLITTPNALENLQALERNFGYNYERCRHQNYHELSDLASLLQDSNLLAGLQKTETQQLFTTLGYEFSIQDAKDITALATDSEFLQRVRDPEVLAFIKKINKRFDRYSMQSLVNIEVSLHPVLVTLHSEFGNLPSLHSWENIAKCAQLRDDPRIFETARRLMALNVTIVPFENIDKLKIIADRNLIGVIEHYKYQPDIKGLIIDNIELLTQISAENPAQCFQEILNNSENGSIRKRQMLRGRLVGTFLSQQRYDMVEGMAGNQVENQAEVRRIVEKLRGFIEAYKVSGKGHTITTLLAMREYREGEDFFKLLQRMEKKLDIYERLIDNHAPHNVPKGLKASIGMEYEITTSTAHEYADANPGHMLNHDMKGVSYFAGVGKGMDAVFEIATKPTDNPYLMLLEMQLLQDLEFIDLNFRRPGYEQGARGYHMTIGGEYGVTVTRNSNFLQNALVISGWGGVNAGKMVDRLSHGRSQNIRQRNSSDTQPIFENTKPAVEFRSLSLDTWEPFERAVETSFYGAVAVQAIEKHTSLDTKELSLRPQTSTPEQFYELLMKEGLIREGQETEDQKIKQIMFEWAKLQAGVTADLADHNENFLQNEMYGYLDERGNYVDVQEFGGYANRERFLNIAGNEQRLEDYVNDIRINTNQLFNEASANLANKCTSITNLFIKNSKEFGGDVTNASSSLDTTKVGRTIEDSDPGAKYKSFFETKGKPREGYYYIQGGSERMLLHRVQMRLLEFNKSMKKIIH